MVLRYYHGDPPAPELVNRILVGPDGNAGLMTRAELCQVGSGQVFVVDEDSSTDIQAEKRFYANEDTEDAGNIRAWFGYVDHRRIGRQGGGIELGAGPGRIFAVDLLDVNAVLGFRLFPKSGTGAAAGDRPSESVGDRLTWLLGTSQMSAVHDNGLGYVAYPTLMLPAADYRGQFGRDVLLDLCKAMEWNAYAYYDEANANIGLWFNDPNSDLFTSTLSISNVLGEADGVTVFAPSQDFYLDRSPSRVFSGSDYTFKNGSVYNQRAATITDFYNRDTSVSEPNVTTLAEATRRNTAMLETIGSEDDRLHGTVRVPSALVNHIQAGMRLWAKLQHLGGFEHGEDYSSGHWTRVLSRTLLDLENRTQEFRDLELELVPITSPGHFLVGFLAANPTKSSPWSTDVRPVGISGGVPVAGTRWTFLEQGHTGNNTSSNSGPFMLADRLVALAEPAAAIWGYYTTCGAFGIRGAHAEIRGLTGPCSVTAVKSDTHAEGLTKSLPDITVPEAGIIVYGFSWSEAAVGAFAGTYLTCNSPVTEIQHFWDVAPPFMILAYQLASGAGTYSGSVTIHDYTGNPNIDGFGAIAAFYPGSDIAIVQSAVADYGLGNTITITLPGLPTP